MVTNEFFEKMIKSLNEINETLNKQMEAKKPGAPAQKPKLEDIPYGDPINNILFDSGFKLELMKRRVRAEVNYLYKENKEVCTKVMKQNNINKLDECNDMDQLKKLYADVARYTYEIYMDKPI